jgi:hypothetical protein
MPTISLSTQVPRPAAVANTFSNAISLFSTGLWSGFHSSTTALGKVMNECDRYLSTRNSATNITKCMPDRIRDCARNVTKAHVWKSVNKLEHSFGTFGKRMSNYLHCGCRLNLREPTIRECCPEQQGERVSLKAVTPVMILAMFRSIILMCRVAIRIFTEFIGQAKVGKIRT